MIVHLLGLIWAATLFWLIATKPRSLGPVAAVLLCLAGCQRLERGSTIGAAVLFAYAMIVFIAFVVFLRHEVKPRR